MSDPVRASDTPYPIEVEAGKSYFWCCCGLSAAQPFCDGSHKGTGLSPVRYDATTEQKLFFCGCKATGKKPFCDGSHSA